VPAAAVTPAPQVYILAVAVKKLVVEMESWGMVLVLREMCGAAEPGLIRKLRGNSWRRPCEIGDVQYRVYCLLSFSAK